MSSIALIEPSTSFEPVRRWRIEQLEAAGYPSFDAQLLSERADADLHVAVGLLLAGCPVDTSVHLSARERFFRERSPEPGPP
jgi:hypothetical protein